MSPDVRAPENQLTEDVLPGMLQDEPQIPEEVADLNLTGEVSTEEETTTAEAVGDSTEEQEEARKYGWRDKDEWVASGKPEKQWRPASEFNDFRRQAASVMAKENRDLRERLERIETSQKIKDEAEAEARRDLKKESLKLRLNQAREDNDWDKAFEIQNEMLDLRFEEAAKPKAQPVENPKATQAFAAMLEANPILKTDEDIQADWGAEVASLIKVMGNGDPERVMNKAMERVKRMYPEKFKTRPAMADTGGNGGDQINPSHRSWNNLKPNIKSEYDKFVRDNPHVTREGIMKRMPDSFFRG